MGKFANFRVTQCQYFAVVVIMLLASFLLYPGRRKLDSSSTTIAMIHLGSFIANYGAQLWVTIVAGLTMFYNLPRAAFGRLQSRLFPMFFLWCLVTSAVSLATFVTLHPYDTWDHSQIVQALCMLINVLTAAINAVVVAPIIVRNMIAAFTIEVAVGLHDVVGYANFKEIKKSNPEYAATYTAFRRGHGVSVSLTLLSIASNTVLLYHIASQCVPV